MTNQDNINAELKALAGRTWAEAFRVFVVEHPNVAKCTVQVIKELPDLQSLFDNCVSEIFFYRRWPISLKDVDLAEMIFCVSTASRRELSRFEYGRSAITSKRDPNIDIPDSVQRVAELIKGRYALFIHALKSGDLPVRGISEISGQSMDIPRGEWENSKLTIEVVTGRLWEGRRRKTGHLYRAMEIARPAAAAKNLPTTANISQTGDEGVGRSATKTQSPRGPEPIIDDALAWKIVDYLLTLANSDKKLPRKQDALFEEIMEWIEHPENDGRCISRSTVQRFCKSHLSKSTAVRNLRNND